MRPLSFAFCPELIAAAGRSRWTPACHALAALVLLAVAFSELGCNTLLGIHELNDQEDAGAPYFTQNWSGKIFVDNVHF